MATTSRFPPSPLVPSDVAERLALEPHAFQFFQAIRLLKLLYPAKPEPGAGQTVGDELVRFRVHPSLVFPASEILHLGPAWQVDLEERGEDPADPVLAPSELTPEQEQLAMTLNFMGVVGPMGTLPIYYTQLVGSEASAGNYAPRDFLDLFHHRFISLFYQAWEKYRLGSNHGATIATCLNALVGLGTESLQGRQAGGVADSVLASYAGLIAQKPFSAVALRNILMDYFEVGVELEEFAGKWCVLNDEDLSALDVGDARTFELAGGAVLGDEVWEPQARVRIVLGPLNRRQYLQFLPGTQAFRQLQGLLRFVGGDEMGFEIRLILAKEHVPASELGAEDEAAPRLGWLSWAKTKDCGSDKADTLLEV